jgi:hypothetical protein
LKKQQQQHIPPSISYLRILHADYWKIDFSYRIYLSKIITNTYSMTLFPDGLAGSMLELSKKQRTRLPDHQNYDTLFIFCTPFVIIS